MTRAMVVRTTCCGGDEDEVDGDKGLVVMKKEIRETRSVRLGSVRLTKKKKWKQKKRETGRSTRERY